MWEVAFSKEKEIELFDFNGALHMQCHIDDEKAINTLLEKIDDQSIVVFLKKTPLSAKQMDLFCKVQTACFQITFLNIFTTHESQSTCWQKTRSKK
jgi:hypothetical protein